MEQEYHALCIRCKHEMTLQSVDDLEESVMHTFFCPHCGATEIAYTNEENDENSYSTGSTGYEGTCPLCGSSVAWDSDFMRSEILCDVDDDDDSLATSLTCTGCGANIDVVDCKRSEEQQYPFYQNHESR